MNRPYRALSMLLLLSAGAARAESFNHVARPGDTPETLALQYYSNRSLAALVREANKLPPSANPKPGQKLWIPSATQYRVGRGETLEVVARRRLGDARRAHFLAEWNGLKPGAQPPAGSKLLLPELILHRATAPESFVALAKNLFGDPAQAKMLQAYNFHTGALIGRGERILIPFTMVRAQASAGATAAQHARKPEDTARLEAEQAARLAAGVALAEKAYRDGNYTEIPGSLIRLLASERPSDQQLGEIHRLLAFAYVALGVDDLALREFEEMLQHDPKATLDAATVSPKIREVFDRAKKLRSR
ncbi:MAG TPA: LysM domain-containing protein [Polyangia bacterium]|jgi:LysM repeat protein|nr:LysM domain-containing protein [Polyangia bacterium]